MRIIDIATKSVVATVRLSHAGLTSARSPHTVCSSSRLMTMGYKLWRLTLRVVSFSAPELMILFVFGRDRVALFSIQ